MFEYGICREYQVYPSSKDLEIGALMCAAFLEPGFYWSSPFSFNFEGEEGWMAHEMGRCIVILEWHPASPSGIPVGSLCREIQVQFDLRQGPDDEVNSSIPIYEVGGTSETGTSPVTLTSRREPRVNQIQPIRVGCSRQIARSANVAAYLKTSDIFALRINGISLVFEGQSEKTRR